MSRGEQYSLEAQIYDALCARGWIIPQADEDVSRTEVDIEHNPISLPPELADPSELLRKLFPGTRDAEPEPEPITDSTEPLHRISRLSNEAAWTTEEVQEALREGGVDPEQLVCRVLIQAKRLLEEVVSDSE